MIVHTQLDKRTGVVYTIDIERDDLQIKGNALVSGDPSADLRAERWVERELAKGNIWAWASVTVTATRGEHQGHDHLGACSYASMQGFLRGGYWRDMKAQALADLLRNEADQTIQS